VDGQDFADIEAYGVERWLAELALALREETYRPEPIRTRVHTEGQRQTQAAGHLDRAGSGLHDGQRCWCWNRSSKPTFHRKIYAYRAGRNAQQAAVEVEELLFRGHPDVVDADPRGPTSGAFRIPTFLKSVARRVVDRRVLHLIKMWLDCPVEETDDRGRKTRTTDAREQAARHSAGFTPSHPCWRTSTCAGLCWGGRRSSALSTASALASLPMRMIL